MNKWILEAEKMYLNKIPYYKIGEKLGIDRKKVSYELRKLGYKSNSSYVRKNITKKYSFNEDIFEKIDTEEKAYWLGFLYADGYVSSMKNDIEFFLKEEDLEHIKRYKSFLNSSHKINKKSKKYKEKEYISYGLRITSGKTKQDLINLGCVPNKSLILKFPTKEQVPNELIHHFVRGYFDGDGCFYLKNIFFNIEIVGNNNFLKILSLKLKEKNIENTIYSFSKNKNVKRIIINKKESKLNFINYIYSNSNIYLNRKHNIIAPYISNNISGGGKIGEG